MEVQHTMDIIADTIPYNSPNYLDVLKEEAEPIVKEMNDSNSDLNIMAAEHDKWMEEHNDLPFR